MIQFMKNNFYLRYRSVVRPNPLWGEQALYGGYTHIELVDGVWVSRMYEAYLHCLAEDVPAQLKQLAIEILSDKNIQFHPAELQQSNEIKLRLLLSKQPYFAIQGYSKAAEDFLSILPIAKVYSDADYVLPNCQKVTSSQLCRLSSHMITLLSYSATRLKSDICNWGNVIVYDAEMFASSQILLQGGSYGITAYK